MKRRSLFKLLTTVVVASSIEVLGWKGKLLGEVQPPVDLDAKPMDLSLDETEVKQAGETCDIHERYQEFLAAEYARVEEMLKSRPVRPATAWILTEETRLQCKLPEGDYQWKWDSGWKRIGEANHD